MKIIAFLFFTAPIFFTTPSMADYIATGPISGMVCTGFLFVSCPPIRVDAIEGVDGELYSLAKRYSDVSEFNGKRCWIELKSGAGSRNGGSGLLDYIINMFGQTFYQKQNDGTFKAIDVDRLMFDCRKMKEETIFSHPECEFTASVPGEMDPMEKKTPIGIVYGGKSTQPIQGLNRKLTFTVECQKMSVDIYNDPNANEILLNTMALIHMTFDVDTAFYNVEKTSFSVHGISRGVFNNISAETIMRTEVHGGRRSMLTLRVFAHQSDVDNTSANEFFKSVSRQ